MWTSKKKILFIMYRLTSSWLPLTRRFRLGGALRRYWCKRIVNFCGTQVNVEHNAYFTPDVEVGDYSSLGINSELIGPVKIGQYVMMGPEVVAYTENHKHETGEYFYFQGYTEKKPVIVGNNVWIGRRVMFMPGSGCGNNCVIAAGAIVTKMFPSDVIIGGNPARIVKHLSQDK